MKKLTELNWFKKSLLVIGFMTSGIIIGDALNKTSGTSLSEYKKELLKELKVQDGLISNAYLLGISVLKEALD
ncbi:MAG: hypothetical protein RLN88_03310 [Ekhidna sp.]|uniref:hypothetical protein n=1 Tax=Ekhidna sp. TaxID=2608089 RepID=UPI0032EFDA7C